MWKTRIISTTLHMFVTFTRLPNNAATSSPFTLDISANHTQMNNPDHLSHFTTVSENFLTFYRNRSFS
uniref:Uncharacterized protein n=1 Tax=Anopheles minimus TaxID=112268 RepID=A0A182WNP6_9DIPT